MFKKPSLFTSTAITCVQLSEYRRRHFACVFITDVKVNQCYCRCNYCKTNSFDKTTHNCIKTSEISTIHTRQRAEMNVHLWDRSILKFEFRINLTVSVQYSIISVRWLRRTPNEPSGKLVSLPADITLVYTMAIMIIYYKNSSLFFTVILLSNGWHLD